MLDLWSEKLLATPYYTFTINPTPSNATVTINGVNTKSVTVEEGTTITWSVSATNYVTQSGSLTLTANTTKNVTLASSLKYACYRQTSYVPNLYYYAKVPLGSDTVVYYNTASASAPASSSSNLGATPYTWTSLSESQAVQSLTPGITFTRYTAGDLYS